jgi:two-component system nitrogen regulation sensor histidine kinase NtrY
MLLCISTGFLLENNLFNSNRFSRKAAKFQDILHSKEFKINSYLADLNDKVEDVELNSFMQKYPQYFNLMNKEGLALLIYKNDSLKIWSDNAISVSERLTDWNLENRFVFLKNGWFVVKHTTKDNMVFIGLILIKNEYTYENQFLTNDYFKDFHMTSCASLSSLRDKKSFDIYDEHGEYLFSMHFAEEANCYSSYLFFPALIYFLGMVFSLLFLRETLKAIKRKWRNLGLLGLGIILIVFYYIIITCKAPFICRSLDIFTPYYFSVSDILPSLGDFLICSVLIFFFLYNIYRDFSLPEKLLKGSRFLGSLIIFFLLSIAALYFIFLHSLFRNLLNHSSITYEAYKVLDLSAYSLIGFTSISLLFVSLVFLINKLMLFGNDLLEIKDLWKVIVLSLFIFPVVTFLLDYSIDIYSIGFYLVLLFVFLNFGKPFQYNFSSLTLLILVFSVFSVFSITRETEKKEKNSRKVIAANFGAEHDPVAELLLEEINTSIKEDPVLANLLGKQITSNDEFDEIFQYLQNNYFNGYWEKYELNLTICNESSDLSFDDENDRHCFTFFEQLIDTFSSPLPSPNFYFLDYQTGNINYFGSFYFPYEGENKTNGLFIRLESGFIYEQLGYPELLLDKNLFNPSMIEKYSYAKYNQNKLITQAGNFPYSLDNKIYSQNGEEFSFVNFEGYDHLVYNVDENNIIIISKPKLRFIDILISFSYLFVYLFLLINLVLLIINLPSYVQTRQFNFRQKIQLSLFTILFFSLLSIGGGAVYFSINQYENRHFENLGEKIRSVLVELEHKLGYETELTSNWQSDQYASLNDLLRKFSNVFYSDINLYDLKGNLLATSRPEVFDKGLTGTKMHTEAYNQIVLNKRAEFVHNETIGKLTYMSAYVPFRNTDTKVLAYLNLPYFTKENLLTREISTLVIAIVNFSVLLILVTMSLAVFISSKITNPLSVIQKEFSKIELGRKSEHIFYEGNDEISSLVTEYNRMVDELARSVKLLAKSERESAWREMAKQIAHEIKNPLTPMRLSVQQLKRSWKDKAPNWEKNLNKFTKTLIEQIDNLSSIANAFSDFAKMPKTENQEVDILFILNNSVELFANTENVDFETDLHGNDKVSVFADKKQLIRVFSNLFKNAVQSIPGNRKGLIKIDILTENENVVVKVTDNGKGIQEELGDKLFMPNFTTKSSGMGMGLAIVKNIIEDAKGTIRYETKIGEGTTFIIELPLFTSE